MIVRSRDAVVQLITQPDHAHLARAIMEHSPGVSERPRRDSILLAIGEHDNGWAEEDAAPIVDAGTGRVIDFVNLPLTRRHAVWPRGVARLRDDPWAAALVAQHALTVYDRFRADAEWAAFFAGMEEARAAMLQESRLPLDNLLEDYTFVRVADLISLTYCTGWTEEQRFRDWTVQLTGDRVVVSPDPFGGVAVPISIDATEIPNQVFRSNEELREALKQATTARLRGVVTGG
jgi:hypothetical protein